MTNNPEYQSSYFICNDCEENNDFRSYLKVSQSGSYCPECKKTDEFPFLSLRGDGWIGHDGPGCDGCKSKTIIIDDGGYFSECVECGGRWGKKSVTIGMKPGEDRTVWGGLWASIGRMPPESFDPFTIPES